MKQLKKKKLTKFDVWCIRYGLILALVAIVGVYIFINHQNKPKEDVVFELDDQTKQTLEKMTDAEFEYFFSQYIKESRDTTEIMAIVDASLKTQPAEKYNDMIDALLYNQGLLAQRYQTTIAANKDKLTGLNLNSDEFIEKINDKLTKTLVQQIYDNHFYIKRVQNSYLVYIDRDFYINKYREFLDEDMIVYYTLSNQIDDNVIYTSTGIDVSRLLENMFYLQKMALTNKHMIVVNNCANAYMQNLYIFLHMMDVNEYTNEDGTFNQAVRTDYENFINANPDNPISALLQEILVRVDDLGGKVDDSFYTYQENLISRHVDALIQSSNAYKQTNQNAKSDEGYVKDSALSKLAEDLYTKEEQQP